MTTVSLASRSPRVEPEATGDVSLRRTIASEWIKFRTLHSSWYTLGAAAAAVIVLGLVIGYLTSSSTWSTLDAEDQVASAPLQGYLLAQLLVGMLGVLFVTGEYGTGMIRSTFAAVPKRLPVLGAKTTVFSATALVAMTASSFVAFFGAQLFLSADGHGASLADPGALRAVVGVGVYLALIGILGGALGWIVRSTAGAIGALVGLLLVLPAIFQFIPGSFGTTAPKFLPSAGESLLTLAPNPDTLGPWAGLAVLLAWVLGAMTVAAVVVRRRDV